MKDHEAYTLREILERMHEDVVGSEDESTYTDTDMIVRILEELVRKVEELETHTHDIR
jgi:hypothetical protein